MKRRDFSLVCGAVASAALVQSPAHAQAKPPVAGSDYLVLDKPAPVEAPKGKVEVVEFFWYNCAHCNAFEPTLAAWIKQAPKDIVVRRVPIAFQADFAPQQQLFYALDALGLVEKLHAKVFAAIHADKQNLAKADAITDWVVKQGVDKAKFLEQFNSFSTAAKVKRATQLQDAYQVDGVPSLGVAGRFLTDGGKAKGMSRALTVVEFLAAKVRSGQ
jgi:thiol:disulfide interchange protein DsbA